MSKYEPLWNYVSEQKLNECKLSFNEIKSILGFDIDHSFLTYKKEASLYGYQVLKISMKDKFVIFCKVTNR